MRWWPYGTDLLMYSWDPQSIPHRSICGELCVFVCCSAHLHSVFSCISAENRSVLSSLFIAVCLRGVGCIFYEMAAGRPLFPGSTVEDELHLIFRLLGEQTHTHTLTSSSPTKWFNSEPVWWNTHFNSRHYDTKHTHTHAHSHQTSHSAETQKCFSPALKTNYNHLSCYASYTQTHTL